jgi:hypothetical protein
MHLDSTRTIEASVQRFGMSLFGHIRDRNPKLGWSPSGSIMTDGVSLCVNCERLEHKVNKICKEEMDAVTGGKRAKRKAAKDASELQPCDDYVIYANACFGDALVLGIDPGRVGRLHSVPTRMDHPIDLACTTKSTRQSNSCYKSAGGDLA